MTIYMNIYNSWAQLFDTSATITNFSILSFFIHPGASIGVL